MLSPPHRLGVKISWSAEQSSKLGRDGLSVPPDSCGVVGEEGGKVVPPWRSRIELKFKLFNSVVCSPLRGVSCTSDLRPAKDESGPSDSLRGAQKKEPGKWHSENGLARSEKKRNNRFKWAPPPQMRNDQWKVLFCVFFHLIFSLNCSVFMFCIAIWPNEWSFLVVLSSN